jgi:hypothetical protein
VTDRQKRGSFRALEAAELFRRGGQVVFDHGRVRPRGDAKPDVSASCPSTRILVLAVWPGARKDVASLAPQEQTGRAVEFVDFELVAFRARIGRTRPIAKPRAFQAEFL